MQYKKNKKKIVVKNDFKDFISINQFSKVIKQIIKYEIKGIYNVSIGEKVYISEIVEWLDKNFLKNGLNLFRMCFGKSSKNLACKLAIDFGTGKRNLFPFLLMLFNKISIISRNVKTSGPPNS